MLTSLTSPNRETEKLEGNLVLLPFRWLVIQLLWNTNHIHFHWKCCPTASLRATGTHSSVQKPLVSRLILSATSGIIPPSKSLFRQQISVVIESLHWFRLFVFSSGFTIKKQTATIYWFQFIACWETDSNSNCLMMAHQPVLTSNSLNTDALSVDLGCRHWSTEAPLAAV